MKQKIVFLLWYCFFLCTSVGYTQSIKYVNDSIVKYKYQDPLKALEFGNRILKQSEGKEPTFELVMTYYQCGEILYYLEFIDKGFEYMYSALELYQLLDESERKDSAMDNPPWILNNLASVLMREGNLDAAEKMYALAIENFNLLAENDPDKVFGLSTSETALGNIEILRNNFDAAEVHFKNVLKRRIAFGKREDILHAYVQLFGFSLEKDDINRAVSYFDTIQDRYQYYTASLDDVPGSFFQFHLGEATLRFGEYYQKKENYTKAREYLISSTQYYNEFKSFQIKPWLKLAEIDLLEGQLDSALQKSQNLLLFKELNPKDKILIFRILEQIYLQRRNYNELIATKDSILYLSTNSNLEFISDQFNLLENKILIGQYQKENYTQKFQYLRLIFLLTAIAFVTVFLYLLLRNRYKLQKERNIRLELESNLLSSELDTKKRELVAKANFISERNENLKRLKGIIEDRKDDKTLSEINSNLNSLIQSENTYAEFEKMFVSVYPDFYKKLRGICKLSPTDLKLASLIKMNHSNLDISRISNVSMRTVESQRYRLSKKLKLAHGNELNDFLQSL